MSNSTLNKELGKEYIEPGEEAIIQGMISELEAQVDRLYSDKKMKRQVHTKMHGCVKASFTIEPNLPEEHKIGVFKDAKVYQAWVRFSNGNTKPKSDKKKDIRGCAIKLMGVPGEKILDGSKNETTQDFLLMSSETFFSKNLVKFGPLLKSSTSASKFSMLLYLLNPMHWGVLGRLMKSMIKIDNPLDTGYWSTQPYRFGGPDKAVKYFLRPSKENVLINENTSDPDFLRTNLGQTLNSHTASFDFCIQLQTNADTMPIEDPTIPWSSPFIKVATLEIIQQESNTPERATFGENMSFNPWHSLPEHEPLGSFNRARKRVYITLSTLRHKKNDVKMAEPVDSPDFLTSEN